MKIHRITGSIAVVILTVLLVVIGCTTQTPTDPGLNGKNVRMSISQKGKYSDTFYGTDLNLIIDFEDSTEVDFTSVISLHSYGAKSVVTKDVILGEKVKTLILPIYWDIAGYGLCPLDSADVNLNTRIDTLQLFIYDEDKLLKGESNKVVVRIKNIAPNILDFNVGDSSYSIPIHITSSLEYSYIITESTDSIINMAFTISDPGNTYGISWGILSNNLTDDEAKNYLVGATNSNTIKYKVRKSSSIRDYVTAKITDHSVQRIITVRFIRSDGQDTKVDSLQFGDTTFTGSATTFEYSVVTLDTILATAYPHALGGTPVWSAANGSITLDTVKNAEGYAIIYKSNSSIKNDTLQTDTLILLDTIQLKIVNTFGDDSTVTQILLYKKPLNTAPVVDSVLTDTLTQIPVDNKVSFIMEAGTSINLVTYARDFEGGSVTYTWDDSNLTGFLSGTAGATVTYTALDSMYRDTVEAIVTDSVSFFDTVEVILFTDSRPVVDSISVDGSMLSGIGPLTASVAAADSFSIVANVSDADSDDSLTYSWNYSSANIDSIYYITLDSNYVDTVTVTATDMYGLQASKDVVITVVK